MGPATGITRICEHHLTASGVPSISVAVGRGGRLVLADAFGYTDVARRRGAAPTTPYLLASVTKPITATAVALLHQRGQIRLDAPVEDYLGGLRIPRGGGGGGRVPTVRQLVHHTGGLGTHFDFYYADRAARRPATAETIERYATLFREPGTAYEYSNLGYGLLDEVIGTVSGRDPNRFIRDEVLAPIGATSGWIGAGYHGDHEPAVRWAADGRTPYPEYDTTHRGASLAWLTASDLVRFGLAHAGGPTVLDDATLRLAHTADTNVIDEAHDGYGFGWAIRTTAGRTILSHGGAMGGVATTLCVVPELGAAVAVLINRTGANRTATAICDHIVGHLVPGFAPPTTIPRPERSRPQLTHGRWVGSVSTYVGDIPLTLTVGPDGGAVVEVGDAAAVPATVEPGAHGQVHAIQLTVPVQLPTPDAADHSPTLVLALDESDGRLHGAARSLKDDEADARVGNCRSHWCELSRT